MEFSALEIAEQLVRGGEIERQRVGQSNKIKARPGGL